MLQANTPVIARQSALLDELYRRHTALGGDYALLDFPNHPNVGDSAIWAGEVVLLRRATGREPSYVCELSTFDEDALREACPIGPIFLHGGGNFGDIWSEHQAFREHVLERLADREIIQLPQSIKFYDPDAVRRCANQIARHPAFSLYVRDRASESFAREHFDCPVRLAPDSAFGLGALTRPNAAKWRLLGLLRTDLEQAGIDVSALELQPDARIADWLDEAGTADTARMKIARLRARLDSALGRQDHRSALYEAVAMERVRRGARLLASGEVLICDRLHAHILAVLLDIPHVLLDNTYGKIWNYASEWTASYPVMRKAETMSDAINLADDLIHQTRKNTMH